MHHLGQEPVFGFPHFFQVKGILTDLKGLGVKLKQLPVVVAHLFKVGGKPFSIDGVAGKASAKVIVDPSHSHFLEGKKYSFLQVTSSSEQCIIEYKVPDGRHGKLRNTVHSSPFRIKLGGKFGDDFHQFVRVQVPFFGLNAVFVRFLTVETPPKSLGTFCQLIRMGCVGIGNAA